MSLIQRAKEFQQRKLSFKSTSDRIMASREVKDLILDLNEIYKRGNDPKIMNLMKQLTEIKRKIEKRLKGRPSVA